MKKLVRHQMVELLFEKRKKSMSICYHLMKKMVFQKISECPIKRLSFGHSKKYQKNFSKKFQKIFKFYFQAAVAAAAKEDFGRSKKGSVKGESTRDQAGNYRAKKAGGDVKKAGQHDPYSYLPLRKDMLNKR